MLYSSGQDGTNCFWSISTFSFFKVCVCVPGCADRGTCQCTCYANTFWVVSDKQRAIRNVIIIDFHAVHKAFYGIFLNCWQNIHPLIADSNIQTYTMYCETLSEVISLVSSHIARDYLRCKGFQSMAWQNFCSFCQEYQFTIWLPKNYPPPPQMKSWPELDTLSFDYPGIPTSPINWNFDHPRMLPLPKSVAVGMCGD